MGEEKGIKRYEPYGFLLVLGMLSMLGVMVYALYKFRRNLQAGLLSVPQPGGAVYAALGVLILAAVLLGLSSRFFRLQQFPAFRFCLSGSFIAGIIFVVMQLRSLPVQQVASAPDAAGYYYLAFLGAVHLLFVLAGVVAVGVWLARVYRRRAYVETFIFSVNPPNILTMKLLIRYMVFVTVLWAAVLLFILGHAA